MTLDELIDGERGDVQQLIESCRDAAQLAQWFSETVEQIEGLRIDIEAFRYAGTARDDSLYRAGGLLAHLGRTRRWLERRMLQCGFPIPWPPTDPRLREIKNLQARCETLRKALRDAGVEVPA